MRTGAAGLRGALYWPLLLPAAGLLACGLFLLAGLEVRIGTTWLDTLHLTQMTGIAIGAALAVATVFIPYKTIVRSAYLLYAANVVLLVLVLVVGTSANQSRRWLSVFGFAFQPSEFMKLTLVVTLAHFIRFRSSYKTFKGLGIPFLLTLMPMALILKQPDLGTALLCIPILFTMLFVAGARLRHLGLIILLGTAGMFPVYEWGLKEYQRERIDGFLAQLNLFSSKPKGAELTEWNRDENYQVSRSKIAIGAGGFLGADESADGILRTVPERQNDFIFAVAGSRWGFAGGLLVMVLFLWLLLATLAVGLRHREPAGRLICVGVFALFGFQAFINIAMTVGLMPITGMTLPFLSAGRSSVVVSILAVALVVNVAARPSYEFGRGDFD